MYKIAPEIKKRSKLSKDDWKEYTKTVWHIANVSDSEHPAVFPEEIPTRLIKLFTFIGETVLDPFAGIGTTGIAALKHHRNAVCIDQNAKYVKKIRENLKTYINRNGSKALIKKGDAISLSDIEDNSIGLIVTSPPYWNKADYGKNKKNLGNINRYKDFILKIKPAFEECYRVLMPGRKIGIVIANVNQHTNHGLLTFPLSTDFINLLRSIGFVMVQEIIWSKDKTGGKWGSHGLQRPIFGSYPYPPNFLFKNVHEYILIFSKPPHKPKNGKKVQSYEELMGFINNQINT